MDNRRKDVNWRIENKGSNKYDYAVANCAVLMDIRDELKQLNKVFSCFNFLALPGLVREIAANTKKPKKKREKKMYE